MPILSPSSVLFKLLLFSTAVLSAAIALKLSAPAVADFAVCEVPSIYKGVVSWMRPPYLYLVINCIIITIVASSKLQSKKLDDVSPPEAMAPIMQQPAVEVSNIIQTNYAAPDFNYNGDVLSDSGAEKVPDFACDQVDVRGRMENPTASFVDDVMSNKENEFVIAKSAWNSLERKDSTEYSPSSVKPPVSARFGPRRNGRSSPEVGKTVLGVSRAKRQDTLESTWKTITEGRAIPLTRHLRKSDTWERDGRHAFRQEEKTPPKTMMTKSETFNDRTNTRKEPSGGELGKMRKEPSLSHDELNRRVEAFIKKFNEDMRLQRQESLNQYKQMIDRGSH